MSPHGGGFRGPPFPHDRELCVGPATRAHRRSPVEASVGEDLTSVGERILPVGFLSWLLRRPDGPAAHHHAL